MAALAASAERDVRSVPEGDLAEVTWFLRSPVPRREPVRPGSEKAGVMVVEVGLDSVALCRPEVGAQALPGHDPELARIERDDRVNGGSATTYDHSSSPQSPRTPTQHRRGQRLTL